MLKSFNIQNVYIVISWVLIVFSININAQEVKVVDNKGTIQSVNNNTVTTASTAPTSPVEGDVWFDTTTNVANIWNGSIWKLLTTHSIGDIKHSIQTTNHDGWYKLDGTAISSLPAVAQTNAATLGLSGNLPDAADRVLKQSDGSEAILITGGQTTTTLSQANLPNVNFSGSTSTDGNHTHNIDVDTDNFSLLSLGGNGYTPGSTTQVQTSESGDHNHTVTVASGGSNEAFERYQPFLVVNIFIYLGE